MSRPWAFDLCTVGVAKAPAPHWPQQECHLAAVETDLRLLLWYEPVIDRSVLRREFGGKTVLGELA